MYLREKSQANPKSRLERCRPLPGSRGVRSAVTIATATGEWLHTKVAHRKPGPSNCFLLGGLVYAGLVHHRKSHIAMTQWEQTQELAKAAGFKDYSDYLQSEHWKKLKKRCVLVQCCVCGTMKGLLGHHIRYRNLMDVLPTDIAAMCERCHEDFHMACRKTGVAYVEKEPCEIASITNGFRLTPWYARWIEKRERKRARREKKRQVANPPQLWWLYDPSGAKLVTVSLPTKAAKKMAVVIRQFHKIKVELKAA